MNNDEIQQFRDLNLTDEKIYFSSAIEKRTNRFLSGDVDVIA